MMKNQKVVLVTGGSGGIGSEICRHFSKAGYLVVVNYNNSLDKAKEVLKSLDGKGHNIFQASTTDSDQIQKMVSFLEKEYGYLDVLVNNSGVTKFVQHADLEGLEDEWIDKIMQVNFRGSFACIRALQCLLEKGTESAIINISSIAARTGIGSNIAYCASKAALDAMTISLGRALAPKIRVFSLSPGWVLGDYARRFSEEYLKEQTDKTPLGRVATPIDVAKAAVNLAETFTFSTGCVIPVDGGRPLL